MSLERGVADLSRSGAQGGGGSSRRVAVCLVIHVSRERGGTVSRSWGRGG